IALFQRPRLRGVSRPTDHRNPDKNAPQAGPLNSSSCPANVFDNNPPATASSIDALLLSMREEDSLPSNSAHRPPLRAYRAYVKERWRVWRGNASSSPAFVHMTTFALLPLITFAGTPTAVTWPGRSAITTAPAPTTA